MSMLSIAFSLFLLMDSIGNIPLFISFLKEVDPKRHKWIIFRELVIALVVIIVFNFIGDGLMKFLNVSHDTIQIAGGVILFIICLKMIFPPAIDPTEQLSHKEEPLIVPLAIPLVAGPAVLAAVMIYARQEPNKFVMMGAIMIAWAASLIVLMLSAFLRQFLGWRGIMALERLMGLVLVLISIQMFLNGISDFMARNNPTL
jgi:multiple antibiotic resistance protein